MYLYSTQLFLYVLLEAEKLIVCDSEHSYFYRANSLDANDALRPMQCTEWKSTVYCMLSVFTIKRDKTINEVHKLAARIFISINWESTM